MKGCVSTPIRCPESRRRSRPSYRLKQGRGDGSDSSEARQLQQAFADPRLPDPHSVVVASAHDPGAIGRDHHGRNSAGLAGEGVAGGDVPHLSMAGQLFEGKRPWAGQLFDGLQLYQLSYATHNFSTSFLM